MWFVLISWRLLLDVDGQVSWIFTEILLKAWYNVQELGKGFLVTTIWYTEWRIAACDMYACNGYIDVLANVFAVL